MDQTLPTSKGMSKGNVERKVLGYNIMIDVDLMNVHPF